MKKYTKILITSILIFVGLSLTSCGTNNSVLLNEYYLKSNFSNNYEEIKIKAEKLGDERYEVKAEADVISIIDKNSEGLDKIEYIFDIEENLNEIKFRSNAKNISFVKDKDEELYYIDDNIMVDSMDTQCDFIEGKTISDQKIIKIDKLLLDVYADLDLDSLMYETRDYLKNIQSMNEGYELNQGLKGEDKNKPSLTNINNNARVVIEYKNKSEDEDRPSLPIQRIVYYAEGGKIIDVNLEKRGKISSFKVYKDENDQGTEVSSFQEQIDFLKNNNL